MEVLVQDIKQEQSAGDSRKDASQRTHISPSNHHSGGTTTSGKFNNNNHQNSNNLSILQNTLTNSNSNNNNHNANASTDSLVRHSTASAPISTTSSSASAPPSSHVTTIKQTKLNGQQLETMAKSSGLSIVHVSLPQVLHFSKFLGVAL